MVSFEVLSAVDFVIFKQVVRGAFNPVFATKIALKSALNLVRTANTHVVCSAQTKEEILNSVTKLDLTHFGYHTANDIEISYTFNTEQKLHQAIIKPRIIYPLSEDISLPEPLDYKTKSYLNFFADEFERIKIRAEKILASTSTQKETAFIASRNLQLLRKLNHDSQVHFNYICSRSDLQATSSDLFIIYVLNLFIIRSIVFYSKFFKPFLNEKTTSEDVLRLTFKKKIPWILKHHWLFIEHPLLYEIITENNVCSPSCEINPEYQKLNSLNTLKIPEPLLKEVLGIIQFKNSIKLNGNTNILADAFYQMLNKNIENGLPYMDSNSAAISKLLSFFVIDKNNEPLNPNSVCTMLKPSNFKKRPHKDDEKKVNLL